MGADGGLAVAQYADPLGLEPVAGGQDVIDLVADVMDTARRVAFEKAPDRRVVPQGVQQLDLGVLELDEDRGDAVGRHVDRLRDLGAEGVPVERARRLQVRHGNRDVVEPADHSTALHVVASVKG